jgi:hypothetical protein
MIREFNAAILGGAFGSLTLAIIFSAIKDTAHNDAPGRVRRTRFAGNGEGSVVVATAVANG